ncbi:polysaccharide deacetylase [Bosea caraganae]|uniref:Polysaccharide deacetylase n=1 Tax=Bosea caraganae TaxID=2763117 RepID=A0A370L2Y6_9HYPH|nr:polysaccharide deacetylase family protein [Bosea caraganae]RDJ20918.1 polysaccharide deacetylase [Bosea caraganae]RDJ22549.1 polysaccharide deacetylase [Bosea caraganae]
MSDAIWQPLHAELDAWAGAGRRVRLWLRDDDAVAPSPQLDALAKLSERHDLPVLLAVIPFLAEPALVERLRSAPLLLPSQHGAWHRNHAPQGEKKSEFGRHRPMEAVLADIDAAKQRLGDLFGPALLPVFVPPWNRIDPTIAAKLPALGFAGLSCFRNFALGPDGGPTLGNTDIDIMDWHGGRIGRPVAVLVEEIRAQLEQRRLSRSRDEAVLGLLLHHRDHDESAWAFLEGLLGLSVRHPAVAFGDPRVLFKA